MFDLYSIEKHVSLQNVTNIWIALFKNKNKWGQFVQTSPIIFCGSVASVSIMWVSEWNSNPRSRWNWIESDEYYSIAY